VVFFVWHYSVIGRPRIIESSAFGKQLLAFIFMGVTEFSLDKPTLAEGLLYRTCLAHSCSHETNPQTHLILTTCQWTVKEGFVFKTSGRRTKHSTHRAIPNIFVLTRTCVNIIIICSSLLHLYATQLVRVCVLRCAVVRTTHVFCYNTLSHHRIQSNYLITEIINCI
jgi:hypothetical protein